MKKLLFLLVIITACQRDIVPIKSRSASVALTDVNIGTTANDGTGDALRTAFQKVNANNTLIENAFATVPTVTEMRDAIADTNQYNKEQAIPISTLAFMQADSNSYGGAMTYNGVVNYVAANGGTGGGGGYEWTEFIVGTTTGAPANADTAFTISQMAGDVIELYRGTTADLHKQWLNETATNGKTGYRYNSSGQIVVRPAWSTNDRAYIKAVPTSGVSKITLPGGASTLLTGLRAGWKMDETSGTQVNDVLSTYTGTTNATIGRAGMRGYAETFDGTDDYVNLGQTVGDVGTNDFSLTGWIYLTAWAANYNSAGIAGNWGDSPYFYVGVYTETGDSENHKIRAVVNFAGSNQSIYSNSAITLNTWTHVAIVADRSGVLTMYVNGVAQTDTEDISAHSAVDVTNNNTFAIGRIGSTLSGHYFTGSIDDVFIWTKALTSDEVEEAMDATHPW